MSYVFMCVVIFSTQYLRISVEKVVELITVVHAA